MVQKYNIILSDVLADPEVVVDEVETTTAIEDAVARDGRVFRDQTAVRKTDEWNAERRQKSHRIGQNWFCYEAEARLKYRLFFP